ncbi:hypothetical protein ABZ215_25020 [Amycolatopsis sp. NPDC006131]|uniref:hypothetical protein n=1 Tax=Amycolatopsis sp. NPDC006131 TaxID=3156731 RepID=UPI0033BCBC1F
MKPNQTRRQRRRAERAQFWAKLGERRALIATIATVVISIAVAIPSQLGWFLDRLTNGKWEWPDAGKAIASTVLLEGVCWLCAILYADATRHHGPVRIYRLAMLAFAGLAAGINYDHGQETAGAVGIVSALGSLMGVGAWELYMHRTRHQTTGLTLAEIRLRWLRWRKHPWVMKEAGSIRATFGLAVDSEAAWRMAYVRKLGNPTIPIAISSPLLDRIMSPPSSTPTANQTPPKREVAVEAQPAASSPDDGSALGVDVREHPVDWTDTERFNEILAGYWEEPDNTATAAPASAPTQSRKTAEGGTRVTREPTVTSAVPTQKRNRASTRSGTGGVQFKPTAAELNGPDDVKDRIKRYLARAEAKGNPTGSLDRKYMAEQFRCSTRHVRDTIKDYDATKEK